MTRTWLLSVGLLGVVALNGCGTLASPILHKLDRDCTEATSRLYGGLKLDYWCVTEIRSDVIIFCLVDMPLSLAADTAILPYTAFMQLNYGNYDASKVVFRKGPLTAYGMKQGSVTSGEPQAVLYDELIFHEPPKVDWNKFPTFTVQIPSDIAFSVDQIDADTALKIGLDKDGVEVKRPNRESEAVFKGSGVRMEFNFGQLVRLELHKPLRHSVILTNSDHSKSYSIPMTEGQLIEFFGAPDSIKRCE